jgi:glucosyl-dolichyl phosphate glucuronosyltransferase
MGSETMSVTVILCTYNRCHSLAEALESLSASVLPTTTEWEVLIVDNNSKDGTRQVAERFCERNPRRFRYIFEPNQGLSIARNTGIREANGEILVFVDDDVIVESSWLFNLTSDLKSGEWAGSGGRILIPPGFSPPPWLALEGPWRQGAVLCAHFDFGDIPGELKEAPYGTNMAFRKEMFDRYGDFRTDLGLQPGREIRNEDTEFGNRLLTGGERLRYVPSAVVYHPVPEERVRKGFIRARWFAVGRSEIRARGPRPKAWGIPRDCFNLPSIALRTFLPQVLKSLRARDPKERFGRQCAAWYTAGKMAEICSQALKGQVAPSKSSAPSKQDPFKAQQERR